MSTPRPGSIGCEMLRNGSTIEKKRNRKDTESLHFDRDRFLIDFLSVR